MFSALNHTECFDLVGDFLGASQGIGDALFVLLFLAMFSQLLNLLRCHTCLLFTIYIGCCLTMIILVTIERRIKSFCVSVTWKVCCLLICIFTQQSHMNGGFQMLSASSVWNCITQGKYKYRSFKDDLNHNVRKLLSVRNFKHSTGKYQKSTICYV